MKTIVSLTIFIIVATVSNDAMAWINCGPTGCRAHVRPNPAMIYGPTGNYVRYRHRPVERHYRHRRRYYNPYEYYQTIPRNYVYHNNWIRYYVGPSYHNGFIVFNNYPYYVYNGYRHRYSHYDRCNYDLVDKMYNNVVRTIYGYSCAQGYNICANLRDQNNWRVQGYRFFCSERF